MWGPRPAAKVFSSVPARKCRSAPASCGCAHSSCNGKHAAWQGAAAQLGQEMGAVDSLMQTREKPLAAGAVVSLGGAAPPKIWKSSVPMNSASRQRASSCLIWPVGESTYCTFWLRWAETEGGGFGGEDARCCQQGARRAAVLKACAWSGAAAAAAAS